MSSSVKSIDITYEPINENNTFTNGDCVTGHVILEVAKDCKIEYLQMKFKGKGEVLWTEKHGENTVVYHSKEKYVSIKRSLLEERKSNGHISPGRHVYPFTFRIPANKQMPSSFHGSHGKIVYKLMTKLSRSLKVPLKASSKINFVSTVDPTTLHELMMPRHDSTFKKMEAFNSGNVRMDVNLEKMGYHQGEGMTVVASIQNNSSRDIKPKYCIYRKHSFFAMGRRRVDTKNLLKETGAPIPPSASQTVTKIISIPPDVEPAILNSRIIKAEYRLRVYLDIKFASDPEIKFPIVLLPASRMPAEEKPPTYGEATSAGAFGIPGQSARSTKPQRQMAPQPAQAPPPYQTYQSIL